MIIFSAKLKRKKYLNERKYIMKRLINGEDFQNKEN